MTAELIGKLIDSPNDRRSVYVSAIFITLYNVLNMPRLLSSVFLERHASYQTHSYFRVHTGKVLLFLR